jgi:8-oxo-dGTP pyrophosphatase MutT (NUDIX family)
VRKPARTVLEQRIRGLGQTQEEFAEYATRFARQLGEPATLSVRHVQRLMAGRKADGSPVGPPRPPTARLLEHIFGVPISILLAPPTGPGGAGGAQPLRVAVAVVRKDAEVLMVSPRARGSEAVTWQFPAGIVKPGLAPETVAVRETLAETNVRCVVERNLGSRIHPATNVLCEYLLCTYVAGTASNVDVVENADVSWVSTTALTRLVPAERIYRPILDALELVR